MNASEKNRQLTTHSFAFNPTDNGGEQLTLTTVFVDNGDGEDPVPVGNQKLTLQSYCNAAHFELAGAAITPEALRILADELEAKFAEARAILLRRTNTGVLRGPTAVGAYNFDTR